MKFHLPKTTTTITDTPVLISAGRALVAIIAAAAAKKAYDKALGVDEVIEKYKPKA